MANEKKNSLNNISTNLNSEKNTNLFFIIASVVLTGFAVFLFYSVLDKTGIINSTDNKNIKPQNVQQLIQVEVLNGCGVAGIGDGLTDVLRSKGIDVVKTGNYRSFDVDNTFIVDRAGKIETAETVADSLNLDKRFIITEKNKSLFLDLTIVIGKDYKKYFQKSRS
ncbi:MAG: LytR C-terminal domain-containing protein [Ignavibacteriaceae bacterium]|nr:LytR C-terminal domain-containing protein [Ignavibacterium sp.]MCC6255897.1 LytR C-terminal domain-containing protein [Ignavibacteriaceae bacterium]HMN23141.1 LytR C-terminal domain-containing protein [Ignavibacteriaceae bacterium]HRN24948.1 LytR C-terminal domain-containing protein [Ignavibacteriaceae bacterium]HRP93517.1 LytR C-terminal domain-containing protein [Ignavibacteriaceae bacterium]